MNRQREVRDFEENWQSAAGGCADTTGEFRVTRIVKSRLFSKHLSFHVYLFRVETVLLIHFYVYVTLV